MSAGGLLRKAIARLKRAGERAEDRLAQTDAQVDPVQEQIHLEREALDAEQRADPPDAEG